MTDMEPAQLLSAREYEDRIIRAQRAISDARITLAVAEAEYRSFSAKLVGAKMQNMELTTTGPCKKPLIHCVYDLRDSRWPRCIFCGSPKYGC